MATAIEEIEMIACDDWHGCYGEGWADELSEGAVAHPAKFSRALLRRIYDHAAAEGWTFPGARVGDPFGGVALGGFEAMHRGLDWTGVELEKKFHALGNANILRWHERYGHRPGWGAARLLQGDSRRLSEVVAGADLAISSPPYGRDGLGVRGGEGPQATSKNEDDYERHNARLKPTCAYSDSPDNLGNLRDTGAGFDLAVSSPPFRTANGGGGINVKGYGDGSDKVGERTYQGAKGERADGNLETLPEPAGSFDAAISSPPYGDQTVCSRNGIDLDKLKEKRRGGRTSQAVTMSGYGQTDGQLGAMKSGGFDAAISSPPYEDSLDRGVVDKEARRRYAREHGISNAEHVTPIDMPKHRLQTYGTTEGQIGAARGDDFWSASRLVLEQLHAVLKPGAPAVFVTKNFVRKGQLVDFSGRWAQLCEKVGFRQLHHHRAMLVTHHGTQTDLFGGDKEITTSRKSFFRRLAEQKGSPRVDFEDVMCFRRD